MLEYEFMRNALFAILIMTPLFGLIGTVIVNNKMAFFSDALGHSALTGIAIGALFGIVNPTISMIIFGVIFALLLNRIKDLKITSRDTIISVFSSTALALGLIILSKNGNFSKFSNYLIGDILSIVPTEIFALSIIAIVVLIFWILFSNKLYAISLNASLAKSKGINSKLVENLFVILIAVIVMIFKKFSSFVYYICLTDIFLRILSFLASNIPIKFISNFIFNYFPSSVGSCTRVHRNK